MKRATLMMLMLAGCGEPLTTPEGCQIFSSPELQQLTAACQQGYYEELARQTGKPVTRCFGGPEAMSCTTQ